MPTIPLTDLVPEKKRQPAIRATTWGEWLADQVRNVYETAAQTLPGQVSDALGLTSLAGMAQSFAQPDTGQRYAMAPPPESGKPGIRAYHGSPHDFEQFSLSKIGTGEGAQAYGHGLYFAEDPSVARAYREQLSKFGHASEMPEDMTTSVLFDNKVVSGKTPSNQLTALERAALAKHYSGGQAQAIRDTEQALQYMTPDTPAYRQEQETLAALHAHDLTGRVQPFTGRTYEVSIAADPAHFLDWDAPLSEHTPQAREAVAAALKQAGYPQGAIDELIASPEPGARLYRELAGGHVSPRAADAELASQRLQQAGIPGIKYLDAGSRAAGTGTRNYVVFDDKLVSIAKKYMLAGLGVEEAIRRAAADLGRPAPSSPQQGPS